MKWGRKNSPSSSSSTKANGNGGGGVGGISSWISKIKQMSGNSKSPPPAKTKQKIKVNSSSPLYADDEEAYWRLSFGKESFEGKKSNTTKSVLGSDVDELQLPVSNYRSCRSITTQSFTNMVSDVRKTKELTENKDREEIVFETPRRKIRKVRKVTVRKSRRTDREDYSDSGRDSIEVNRRRSKSEQEEKDFLNLEPIKTMKNNNFTPSNARKSQYISSSNSTELRGRSIEEGNQSNLNKPDRISEEIDDSDPKIVIKTETQRRSIDQRKDEEKRRTSKAKIYSPRTPSKVEFLKIRAIEEMKKSKLKKKKEEEMEGRRRRGLESCAMVKCSYDPQNDFRDSMVEMILEKKIRRPEELEELLACYLTLNSDEYHDLIIKVFKQVWFDLNRSSFSPELENQDHSYSDY